MTSRKTKRCPNGTRKNKKTGKCEKIKRREIKKIVVKPSSAKKHKRKDALHINHFIIQKPIAVY